MDAITLDNGQTVVPDWAKESTMKRMAADMSKLSKTIQDENIKLIRAITSGKGTNNDANQASNNANSKAQDENTKQVKKASREYNNARGLFVDMGSAFGGAVQGIITGIGAVTGAVAALAGDVMLRYTGSLNRLTDVGLNQADEFVKTNFELRTFGLSLADATNFTLTTAGAFQALGGESVNKMLDTFDTLNDAGSKFGLRLEDNIEIFRDELRFATRMGNIGELDLKQRQQLVARTSDLLETQIAYSGALGESVEVIRMFAINTLENATDFQARLLLTSEATRQEMLKGAQEFVSVLRATGGELGGELAAAAIEAGSFGAIGFSEAAKRFITVLPTLAGSFNNVINDFNRGLIDGEEAALMFTEQLGNLSEGERQRIFAIARTGDQQALQMSKGIMQFEKAAKKISDMGESFKDVTPVEYQRMVNLVSGSGSQLIETITAVKDKFVMNFLMGIDYNNFNNSFASLREALINLAETFFDIDGDTSALAEMFGKKLPVAIDYMTVKISQFNTALAKFLEDNEGVGYLETFKAKIIPILENIGKMLEMEFKVMIAGLVARLMPGSTEEKVQAAKDRKREEITLRRENAKNEKLSKEAYDESLGRVYDTISIGPPTPGLSTGGFLGAPMTKGTVEITTASAADRIMSGRNMAAGFLGDVNTPGVGNLRYVSDANQNILSLGDTKMSQNEKEMLERFMNQEASFMDKQRVFRAESSELGFGFTDKEGRGKFKDTFDTNRDNVLSNEELKNYFETLILLTRKQTKVVEEGNQ